MQSRLTLLQSVQALTEIQDFLQFIKGEGVCIMSKNPHKLDLFLINHSPKQVLLYFISVCKLPQAADQIVDGPVSWCQNGSSQRVGWYHHITVWRIDSPLNFSNSNSSASIFDLYTSGVSSWTRSEGSYKATLPVTPWKWTFQMTLQSTH